MATPGYIVTSASVVQCPHGGVAHLFHVIEEFVVDGHPAVIADSVDGISGCAAEPACLQLVWKPGDGGLRFDDRPLLTTMTVGVCETGYGVPNGEPRFVSNQLRVEA